MNNYTEEQMKDVQDRVEKVTKLIEELQLQILTKIESVEIQTNVFAQKFTIIFGDTKYLPKKKEEAKTNE